MKSTVSVAYDLAGGIAGSSLWPYTIRFKDQEGGTMRIAQPGILVDPWNPVAGSNWIYDQMPERATADAGLLNDPYTGLTWPQRIEKAEITVKEGLPVAKTLDWITVNTAPSIEVPGDAWVSWDPINEKFITAAEYYTETQTAMTKRVVTYPADLWTTVKWHDGSPITMGDFVMSMIMTWATGVTDSPIFDASQAETLAAFQAHFKGVKVISTDPLVIETYDDLYALDAENMVSTWWPAYAYGPGSWSNITIGVRAEMTGTLAFSAAKAEEKKVEWMSYIAGPSLDILKKELDKSIAENYIPFAPTMSQYVTAEEATLRWKNLNNWYKLQGHFWVGTGPFYIDKAFPIEATLTLARFENFADTSDKWSRFGAPKIAVAELDGPGQIKIGDEATYDVYVTFEGAPYANADISEVKFLLFDAKGVVATIGVATAVEDGHFTVVLSKDVTSKLEAGSNKLVIAVSSKVVSIPTFANFEFVTAAP
jgi:peptide/nickel transport system substrate-binding protein